MAFIPFWRWVAIFNEVDKQYAVKFGAFIRTARESKSLYQSQVADMLGITQSHLSRIEAGGRIPDLFLSMRICDALGLDLNDFVKQFSSVDR